MVPQIKVAYFTQKSITTTIPRFFSIKRAKTLKSILNTFDELDHETHVKNVVDIAEQIGNLKVLENLREL